MVESQELTRLLVFSKDVFREANEEQQETPYVPTGMEITTMCFISNEDKMEQFNACILKGHMKDRNGKKVHIS